MSAGAPARPAPEGDWGAWVGREAVVADRLDLERAAKLAATLDRAAPPGDGAPLPPLWHWVYFTDAVAAGDLGEDGHPKKGGFLPPVDLPRRMWAGGRLWFEAPLPIGQRAEKRSRITAVKSKQGRSGPLVFVTVRHETAVVGASAPAIIEEQDIVYRGADSATPGEPSDSPREHADWMAPLPTDTVTLFRYSALTFNAHRIHFDRDYATGVEGYRGLVVHGPLQATLLAGLAVEHATGERLRRFAFRSLAPAFDGEALTAAGVRDGAAMALRLTRADGVMAMRADAIFETA